MVEHERLGRWPGKSNIKAHQKCQELWKAADGPLPEGWGKSGSVAVWRNHLKATKGYRPPHPAGTRVQRILVPDIRRKPARRTGELAKLLYNHSKGVRKNNK
jgi:hypothetical protein